MLAEEIRTANREPVLTSMWSLSTYFRLMLRLREQTTRPHALSRIDLSSRRVRANGAPFACHAHCFRFYRLVRISRLAARLVGG